MAHCANIPGGSYMYATKGEKKMDDEKIAEGIRIRKLTPRECMMLMDFDYEDYDKMHEHGLSDSRIYKAAGNSIVVNCLTAILGQVIPGKEEEYKKHAEELEHRLIGKGDAVLRP